VNIWQEIRELIREADTAVVRLDAPWEQRADLGEMLQGILDLIDEETQGRVDP